MAIARLEPRLQSLSEEYVLVPAWKKAHDYIRQHNWYADVLDLDLANADLEERLREIAQTIRSPDDLRSEPLRLVLAPKSQKWNVKNGKWEPVKGPASVATKLRPLAYVSVRDQVIATAFMILFADILETRQGDPRSPTMKAREAKIVSYGHRLFCDDENGKLRFRWGNAAVYRQYFQDYQAFVARPGEIVAEVFKTSKDWAVIHADLSQYYDRVRPQLLHQKIRGLLGDVVDGQVLTKFTSFFNWNWHPADLGEAMTYAQGATPRIAEFNTIALPQGLVASGFFANAVLVDFDEAVSRSFDQWHGDGAWQLIDYCRYVDDMRLVVRIGEKLSSATDSEIRNTIITHLQGLLNQNAHGLLLNPDKCTSVLGRFSGAGTIPLSSMMKRVNHNTSGVMDLFLGEETVDLIEGLFLSREEEPLDLNEKHRETFFMATPDVRDETVARFAANRFRRTFRSLRPLCEDNPITTDESLMPSMSRVSLDQKAAIFSRRLIERWIRDPSNVRLLRVALDLRPDADALNVVLDLLEQYIGVGKKRKAPRRVAWYCAAEILKAGATETGLVSDADCLPADIDLTKYQEKLARFASFIVSKRNFFPWYLVHQAFLFLACVGQFQDRRIPSSSSNAATANYLRLHHTLAGRPQYLRKEDVIPFTLVQMHLANSNAAATTFLAAFRASGAPTQRKLLLRILSESEELARDIWSAMSNDEQQAWRPLFATYGALHQEGFPDSLETLPISETKYPMLAVARSPLNPFRQEYAAIHFALAVLDKVQRNADGDLLFPSRIRVTAKSWRSLCPDRFPIEQNAVAVDFDETSDMDGRYALPSWSSASSELRWKYQLGQILRVLLTGQSDFTLRVPRNGIGGSHVLYSPYTSSWLRRRYGMFNGRNAFGPAWLPISSWLGSLLTRLLEWPGFARFDLDFNLPDNFDAPTLRRLLSDRIRYLEAIYGRASYTPIIPVRVPKHFMRPRPPASASTSLFSMRVGVVQTVLPRSTSFSVADPQLNAPATRQLHRRHLSAVLGGVHRMLQVRETHSVTSVGIELLVLPELALHPDDIYTHLVPFVLQHQCVACTGVVFHPRVVGGPLINSCYWIIPVKNPNGGLKVEMIEQGKWNLTPEEIALGITQFRPAQWILEIVDPAGLAKLWAMSGAVCYDSTDLCLAADLRKITDMFVIPALNPDVGTFDNMAAALNYHMFQHVIVSNCGEYGGSTGQAPFADRHRRTIFHSHGNEQVSVSFFEVDLHTYRTGNPPLKTPPAGYTGRT